MSDRPISRRQFLSRSASMMAVGGIGAFGYTWRIEPHWVSVVHRDLPIRFLPAALEGKTLIHISDIHVGTVVNDDYLIDTFARVAALEPDIMVITGDLMSYDDPDAIAHAVRVLKHLPAPPMGIYTVLGNHDYGNNWRERHVADQLVDGVSNAHHRVLRNEAVNVGGLTIAGMDEYWSPAFGPQTMTASLEPGRANLVLCHNPDVADEDVWNGYQGWILCGHTHGGQCRVPFLGPPVLPVRNRRYTEGEIDLHDGRMMYINRGLGYLKRVRFNVRPEITVCTLRTASAGQSVPPA